MSLRLMLFALLVLVLPVAALAQWQLDGTPVSTPANDQADPQIASDGAGGAIITWYDNRSGANFDIYAQRLDVSGAPLWIGDGVPVCTAVSSQVNPTIVADGSGGAIITWSDRRSGNDDIYAQRIDASGAAQWTGDGVVLCNAANSQSAPRIISDGAGGAIVTWNDLRSDDYDIYAQRINSSGVVQWTANGVALCVERNIQQGPQIVTDGAGGAIVTWQDSRSTVYDIYAQRVDAAGVPQWAANGVALCTAVNGQLLPTIASDGANGAIVTWEDGRTGGGMNDIYAQRVDGSGTPQWTANGVALCTATNDQNSPAIVPDGSGGAVVTWVDGRTGGGIHDIYAQRIDNAGTPRWTTDGVALCSAANDQNSPAIAPDGSGGAVVTWRDSRTDAVGDIYAQRIDTGGTVQWTADGVALCSATLDQLAPAIVADGLGAIVAWQDNRNTNYDIYAQRVELRYGEWGHPEPTLVSAADDPGDQGGLVAVDWNASGRDVSPQVEISRYTIWRATDQATAASLAAQGAAVVDVPFTGNIRAGKRVVWHERTATADYYWEFVGDQVANYSATYSFDAPTREDSTGSNPATHYFRVVAEGQSQFYHWTSNVVSAHSADNLAPTPPSLLTAQRVGGDVYLQWDPPVAPDLRDYAVYRATAPGVNPGPMQFIASTRDTFDVDTNAPTGALYYIVTAYDVHGNQSAASNEASVSPATGVGNTPALTALTVLQNEPNPFTATTQLRIGLPAASDVSIEVYDVAGRRVRTESLDHAPAGWRSVAFDGYGDNGQRLASGVYFYRVRANGTTVTNKMVITR